MPPVRERPAHPFTSTISSMLKQELVTTAWLFGLSENGNVIALRKRLTTFIQDNADELQDDPDFASLYRQRGARPRRRQPVRHQRNPAHSPSPPPPPPPPPSPPPPPPPSPLQHSPSPPPDEQRQQQNQPPHMQEDNDQHFDNLHWDGIPDLSDDDGDLPHGHIRHPSPPRAQLPPLRHDPPHRMPVPRPARGG
ncbi:hypothetical protein H0H81_012165 [Sphagnurus paluster]|uniref:Uncharacterized protein n=1 Tax=Sphagnurus paluster TaxID=117069 RepID=A0A9P7G0I2_9AGAR|nr:hypothetical protein H0H81_012165 [Sphagnurus paluster]